jgi:hypothetical protein
VFLAMYCQMVIVGESLKCESEMEQWNGSGQDTLIRTLCDRIANSVLILRVKRSLAQSNVSCLSHVILISECPDYT